jgi:hypothetical protein
MYVCIRSNTTQGSLYYNVLITFQLHVSAFFHRAIIRLVCEEVFSVQMWLRYCIHEHNGNVLYRDKNFEHGTCRIPSRSANQSIATVVFTITERFYLEEMK